MTASNSQGFKFDYDSQSGKYGYVVSEGGADTFIPFSSVEIDYLTWQVKQSPITKTYPRPIKGVFTGLRTGNWVTCEYWYINPNNQLEHEACWANSASTGNINAFRVNVNGNTLTFNGDDYAGHIVVLY